jgi:hypothetical protein
MLFAEGTQWAGCADRRGVVERAKRGGHNARSRRRCPSRQRPYL